MKVVTSATVFQDAVGMRLSITYSEIDETGRIIADNKRVDRVVVDTEALAHMNAVKEYAATLIEE